MYSPNSPGKITAYPRRLSFFPPASYHAVRINPIRDKSTNCNEMPGDHREGVEGEEDRRCFFAIALLET